MEVKERISNYSFDHFLKFGLRSVSMEDISRGLGLSKKTLYQHFKSKRELIKFVLNRYIICEQQCIIQVFENKDYSALQKLIWVGNHIKEFLEKMKPSLVYELKKYYSSIWEVEMKYHFDFLRNCLYKNLIEGIRQGDYRSNLNLNIVADLLIYGKLVIHDQSIFPSDRYDLPEIAEQQSMIHLYGICSPKGMEEMEKYKNEILLLKESITNEK